MDPFLDSIKCKTHADNDIVYICQNRSCRIPLCLRCLKEHSSFHKAHKTNLSLVTLTEFKKSCKDKLSLTLDHFLEEIKAFEHYYLMDTEVQIQMNIKEAEECREYLMNIINSFFENFRVRMHNHLTQMRNITQSNVVRSLENMKKLLAELNNFYLNIENNFDTRALESLMKRDFIEEFEDLKNKTIEKFEKMTVVDLKVNHDLLPSFAEKLNEIISITQKPFEHDNKSEEITRKKPEINQTFFEEHCSQKLLHFFQDSTKLLKIIDFENLLKSTSKKFSFEQIELDIPFDIPTWHKSVTTPQGHIYITGGLDVTHDNLELADCFEMDFLERKLKPIAKLIKARYGHEMVHTHNGLYVIGGSNDSDGMLDHCERFDISSGKWEEIARLNKKAFGPAACVWEQKYIYKFGGLLEDKVLNNTIERYLVDKNKWEVLNFEMITNKYALFPEDFFIPWCSGVAQLNSNQILVFGGYSANNENSQQSFIFTICDPEDEKNQSQSREPDRPNNSSSTKNPKTPPKHYASHLNKWMLPVGEGFWNSQAIALQNNIYCLQNIQVEEFQSSTKPDLRRLLVFANYKWEQMELDV